MRVLPLLVDTSHTDDLVLAAICGGYATPVAGNLDGRVAGN